MATHPNNPPPVELTGTESPYGPLPAYSASERPTSRPDRIAFQIWVLMFLFIIVFTLLNYLLGRLIPAANG